MNNDLSLLNTRDIIDILIGDTHFDTISMKYLSGPELCSLSTQFGLTVTYSWEKRAVNKSRWQYMQNLLKYTNKNNTTSNLLLYLLNKISLNDIILKNSSESSNLEEIHNLIINTIINEINKLLFFSNKELIYTDNLIYIQNKSNTSKPIITKINNISNQYINELTTRCKKDLESKNYDSVVTKSRTLIEETLIYVIEQNNQPPINNGDISKLYNQFKSIYSMHQNASLDKRINNLLSGLEKIVFSIAELRNNNSDSHGMGTTRISLYKHHATLVLNASMIFSEFILGVYEYKKTNKITT